MASLSAVHPPPTMWPSDSAAHCCCCLGRRRVPPLARAERMQRHHVHCVTIQLLAGTLHTHFHEQPNFPNPLSPGTHHSPWVPSRQRTRPLERECRSSCAVRPASTCVHNFIRAMQRLQVSLVHICVAQSIESRPTCSHPPTVPGAEPTSAHP